MVLKTDSESLKRVKDENHAAVQSSQLKRGQPWYLMTPTCGTMKTSFLHSAHTTDCRFIFTDGRNTQFIFLQLEWF